MATVRTKSTASKSFNLHEWMGSEDGYAVIQEFAVKYAAFSRGSADDLFQDIALALLEREAECPKTKPAREKWLERVAEETADKTARQNRPAKATASLSQESDGDEFTMDVADTQSVDLCHDDEPAYEFCSELVAHEKRRAARIRTALNKLTEQHREVIRDRFFSKTVLSAKAAGVGMCDSSHRMRLLRAKKKLSTLIDSEGFALAA